MDEKLDQGAPEADSYMTYLQTPSHRHLTYEASDLKKREGDMWAVSASFSGPQMAQSPCPRSLLHHFCPPALLRIFVAHMSTTRSCPCVEGRGSNAALGLAIPFSFRVSLL